MAKRGSAVSDDRDLARRCLSGDLAATRELVERFQHEIYGLCARLLRHHQDSEDVAQEVFLRIFRSLGKWDPTRPLRPWVLTIAVNRCRTWLAKRPKRPEPVEYLADWPGKEAPVADGELTAVIADAVENLRDEYREVFVLFHESGRSYEEIAEVVGRPVGTVKTWLHRARAIILARLNQLGLMPEPEAKP